MNPKLYLAEICRPNVTEFTLDPTSVRRAWIAAASLHHFADCVAVHRGGDLAVVRAEIAQRFPQFPALSDVANVTKHFELTRGSRPGLRATDFEVGRGAAFSDGSYYSDGSSHSDARKVVRLQFEGRIIDVHHLCEEALKAFEMIPV